MPEETKEATKAAEGKAASLVKQAEQADAPREIFNGVANLLVPRVAPFHEADFLIFGANTIECLSFSVSKAS